MTATRKSLSARIAPRPKGWLKAEQRHARQVAILRLALPGAAALLLLAVFIWPIADGRKLIALPPTPATPQLTMQNPRFTGTDEQNRPFTLSAKQATQQPQNLMLIDLVDPQAALTGPDGRPVKGQAVQGRYDQTSRKLWLGGAVTLEQSAPDGKETLYFTTSELNADLVARTAWGDKPARLTGSFGSIEGQGFRVIDGGKVLLFTGASRAILNVKTGLTPPVTSVLEKPKD